VLLKGIWYRSVLPPILLEVVAVTWWPGAGLLQLELVWSGFEVVPWVQHQDNVPVGAVLLLDLVVLLRLRSWGRFWFLTASATAVATAASSLASEAWLEL
jgi:hypothetical protein